MRIILRKKYESRKKRGESKSVQEIGVGFKNVRGHQLTKTQGHTWLGANETTSHVAEYDHHALSSESYHHWWVMHMSGISSTAYIVRLYKKRRNPMEID